jgi:CheY-like chemotaxis protein
MAGMMGGNIWVDSESGGGSTFHFTISTRAAPKLLDRPHLVGEKPQLVGKRLLVVDDNSTNRRIVALQCQQWGMQVKTTASPKEALEWISKGDPFDLAILDMQMPEMDGLQLASEIRKFEDIKKLPLVLFSSLSSRESSIDPNLFAGHLLKPLKPSSLYDVMMNIFSESARSERRVKPDGATIDPSLAIRLPLRILLAEDNIVNQKLALRLLSQMGYRADLAANGIEVIQSLERQMYDLILMDVQMPEMDGLEASRRICARWPKNERPEIVAMTANAMQGDRELCLEAGMDDYVSKPIKVEELVAALTRIEPHKKRGEG